MDDLRKLFTADQNEATLAGMDWKPLVMFTMGLMCEARAQGATPQETMLLLSSWWAGMFRAANKDTNEGPV